MQRPESKERKKKNVFKEIKCHKNRMLKYIK